MPLESIAAPRPLDTPPEAPSPREGCVSCGRETHTPFCPWCGEKRPEDRHYTLRGFAHESFESVSDVDGRLWRSLRTLFNRPGELTLRYMRGERVGWLPPLRLFLLVNVLFFLVSEVFNSHGMSVRVFDTPLRVQRTMQPYSERIEPLIQRRLVDRRMSLPAYEALWNRTTSTQARSLIILMVPAFAAAVALVNVRKRKPLLHHVAFAFQGVAALLGILIAAYAGLVTAAIAVSLALRRSADFGDAAYSLVLLVCVGLYFGKAQARAYEDGLLAAVIKGTVLAFAFGILLQFYRPLLFFVTYWTT